VNDTIVPPPGSTFGRSESDSSAADLSFYSPEYTNLVFDVVENVIIHKSEEIYSDVSMLVGDAGNVISALSNAVLIRKSTAVGETANDKLRAAGVTLSSAVTAAELVTHINPTVSDGVAIKTKEINVSSYISNKDDASCGENAIGMIHI